MSKTITELPCKNYLPWRVWRFEAQPRRRSHACSDPASRRTGTGQRSSGPPCRNEAGTRSREISPCTESYSAGGGSYSQRVSSHLPTLTWTPFGRLFWKHSLPGHVVLLEKLFGSRWNIVTGIPCTFSTPTLVKLRARHMSVEYRVRVSETSATPGGNKPSEDPRTFPHSPSKAGLLVSSFHVTILPRSLMLSCPVFISIFPSAQVVPFLWNKVSMQFRLPEELRDSQIHKFYLQFLFNSQPK